MDVIDLPFNRKIFNKVEKLIEYSENRFNSNYDRLIAKTNKQSSAYDKYRIFIQEVNKIIDELEAIPEININSVCSKGCINCCKQAIYIRKFEHPILIQYIKQYHSSVKRNILDKSQKIIHKIKNEVPIAINEFEDITHYIKNYLKLDCVCPLLDDNGACMIYEIRPLACCKLRNYGEINDCISDIAPHTYNFIEYDLILRNALSLSPQDVTHLELLPNVLLRLLKK